MGSWGTDLWDQRGVFEVHTQTGIDFLDKSAAFIKDRIRIEQEYAKSLRRLVKQFQFKKKDDLPFTYLNTFKRFLDENDEFASQRETIAEEMNTKILHEMTTLSASSKVERKKALHTLTQYKEELQHQHKGLVAAKKKFDGASEEANVALKAYENASQSLDFTKGQVNKLQKTSQEKGQAGEKAREGYKTSLDSYNGKQTLYYEVDVPNLVTKEIQDTEEKRMEMLAGFWLEYGAIQQRSAESGLKSFQSMVEAAKSCDPAKDSLAVIDRNKTGVLHPGDLPFEEYGTGRSTSIGQRPAKKKVSKRPKSTEVNDLAPKPTSNKNAEVNDFSDLPPAQRREKINETIASLQRQLSELEKSNLGISGDKRASKIESEEMERIKQMIHQYQSYLPDIVDDNGNYEEPPSPSPVSAEVSMPVPPVYEEGTSPVPPTAPPPPGSHGAEESSGIPPPPPPPPPPPASPLPTVDEFVEQICCSVLYEFKASQDYELSIAGGEELVLVEEDDGSGWTKVARGDEQGYIPTSYIHVKCSSDIV